MNWGNTSLVTHFCSVCATFFGNGSRVVQRRGARAREAENKFSYVAFILFKKAQSVVSGQK